MFALWRKKEKWKDGNALFWFVFLVGLTLFVSYPAFTENVITGNDIDFHVTRIESLKDGLLDGQFPVRISPDFYNGYGYANSILYGELFLYVPALLRVVGFSLSQVYNFYLIAINVLTIFGGFWAFRGIFRDSRIAAFSTILYSLAPYRLNNVYVRSAAGEYTAMAFLPFVLYGFYALYSEEVDSKRFRHSYLPIIIGLTGIIQSHTLSIEMIAFAIFMVCVLLLPRTIQKKRFWMLAKSALLTLGLNLWFIIPFIDYYATMDLRLLVKEKEMIQTTGAFFVQLFNLFPVYATKSWDGQYGFTADFPLALGPAMIFGAVLCLGSLWYKNAHAGQEEAMTALTGEDTPESQKKRKVTAAMLVFLTFVLTWAATIYFPWDKVFSMNGLFATLVSAIQFSWRFLSLASVAGAAASGMGIVLLAKEDRNLARVSAAILSGIAIVGGAYMLQINLQNAQLYGYTDLASIRYGTVQAACGGEFVLGRARNEIVTGVSEPQAFDGAEVLSWKKSGTHVTMEVKSESENGYVLLPLLNYKGYTVKGDGNIGKSWLFEGDGARVRLNLPDGYHGKAVVYFSSPWYWRVAEMISLLTLIGIIWLEVRPRKSRKEMPEKEAAGKAPKKEELKASKKEGLGD